MKIGIIGLGLIGGSMAKTFKENTEHQILGLDIEDSIVKKAIVTGAIDEELKAEELPECELLILALYPQATIDFVKQHREQIRKGGVVLDCCGVKRVICAELEPIAKEQGFLFMGGHPMAGAAHSGFNHAKKALFQHASMILTPAKGTQIEAVQQMKQLFLSIGFQDIVITTPEEHDRMIAFTSQLAHVVSGAYIKSETALQHQGFSAGSYKDMTRVAKLKEDMWTELFLCNPQFLTEEIEELIQHLEEYKQAIQTQDKETLCTLLREGKERKMTIDGEKF
ncbi:MAG: prephenate dehydrogenase [Lachnospiraceae bacterium]